jgi:glutamate-1-semialdehyde 2,1-aminomutase
VDICFARGTFNAHPYVMATMDEFLARMETPEIKAMYANLDETWNSRASELNRLLEAGNLPVRVANLSTIWTVFYTHPSRYNWMLQYYLRREGVALSWVGTGRLIFPLNYSAADFAEVARRFIAAAEAMARDGWWWAAPAVARRATIRRQILYEMLRHSLGR